MNDPGPVVCPICRKPAQPALHPFCSRRCADVDLGRWLTAQYAIPARPGDDEADNSDLPEG